jgi:molybdate transport system ATP-binding protein
VSSFGPVARVVLGESVSPALGEPLVELERVDVTLRSRRVLSEISWTLRTGEHVALTGANGSGKSTLLRVLRGELWPDPGGIRRYSFTDAGPIGALAKIAYVSPEQQERHRRLGFAMTGRDVIASGLFGEDYVPLALSAAQDAEIDALIGELGLESPANADARTLSHGALRRILIARALAGAPRIVLLDEFASGLDARARTALFALLERIADRTTLVCASHRVDHLPRCVARELHLREGRIAPPHAPRHQPRFALAPAAEPAPAARRPLVRIAGADVVLGGKGVLHGIEWTISPGEHWVIRGPNGAGKSTLARLVAGTAAAVLGATIERFGEARHVLDELKTRIVLLSDETQTGYDRNETAAAVIASGFFSSVGLYAELDAAQHARVGELLDRFELRALAGRPFLQLSFGERRRVLIARALVREPAIFIADEATEGLDPAVRTAFLELLDDLARRGTTLVLVAHDDALPHAITHELRLEGGRIVARGTLPAPALP